jgi:hypothetical protein
MRFILPQLLHLATKGAPKWKPFLPVPQPMETVFKKRFAGNPEGSEVVFPGTTEMEKT